MALITEMPKWKFHLRWTLDVKVINLNDNYLKIYCEMLQKYV